MKATLTLLSMVSFVVGILIFSASKGAIHEISGFIVLSCSFTLLGFVGVIDALEKNNKKE